MNIIGESVAVVDSSDPTLTGRKGEIVLETSKTLMLESAGKRIRLPKSGTVLQVVGTRKIIDGSDVAGRLEDRLRSKKA